MDHSVRSLAERSNDARLCCLICPPKRIDERAQLAGINRLRLLGLRSMPRDQPATYQRRADSDQRDTQRL